MENWFDGAAAEWDTAPKQERARRAAALLREQLPLRGDERVLDLGAGTGQLSLNLADAVGEVVVSDSSRGMVDVARRNIAVAGLADRLRVVELDLVTDDGVAPESFDGVWSMLALHHVRELDLLLGRVQDVLRPGGWLAIIDLELDPDGAFHSHMGPDFHGHHGFDREELRTRLHAAGFVDVAFTDAGVVEKEAHGHHAGESHEAGHDPAEPVTRFFPMFLAIATRP